MNTIGRVFAGLFAIADVFADWAEQLKAESDMAVASMEADREKRLEELGIELD